MSGESCDHCGAPLLRAPDGNRVCPCRGAGLVQCLRLAVVLRLSTQARWILIAAIPPVLVVSLSSLPGSLGTLNLLGLLLLAQGYFNGRIASLKRACEAEIPAAGPLFIDRAFDRDVLVVVASAVIALIGYAYLLQLLFLLR